MTDRKPPDTKSSSAFCTFGLDKWLESLIDVTEAPFTVYDPVQRSTLLAWERKNNFKLPEDLRNFYLSNDGIDLKWYCNNQNEHIAGQIKINSLMSMKMIDSSMDKYLVDGNTDQLLYETSLSKSTPNSHKYYSIGPADYNSGQILINSKNSQFYLLDNALYLWQLPCPTFSDYFRLAILHCGVRNWHYIFTNYGLPIMSSFLLKLVCPGRLNMYLKQQKLKISPNLLKHDQNREYLEHFDFDEEEEDESEPTVQEQKLVLDMKFVTSP